MVSTEDKKVMSLSLTFEESPYELNPWMPLEKIEDNGDQLIKDSNLEGKLYFAGETATKVDDRSINNRDLVVIVSIGNTLILIMLFS